MILLAALIVAGVVYWTTQQMIAEMKAAHVEAARARAVALMQMFAPAIAAATSDPRALLVWHPLAQTARKIFPVEFSTLDTAAGGTFPFSRQQVQAAHARWTADWLAWERTHDAEYKLKAAEAEHAVNADASPVLRARLDAVEREKLDTYQRRYQEYVTVAKALQALAGD